MLTFEERDILRDSVVRKQGKAEPLLYLAVTTGSTREFIILPFSYYGRWSHTVVPAVQYLLRTVPYRTATVEMNYLRTVLLHSGPLLTSDTIYYYR